MYTRFWVNGLKLQESGLLLLKTHQNDTEIVLAVSEPGILALSAKSNGAISCMIQTVEPVSTGDRMIWINVSRHLSGSWTIYINGIQQRAISVKTFPIFTTEELFVPGNRLELFLGITADLRQRILKNDSYSLVKSSELLRQLLFDPYDDLLEIVSNEINYREPIEFYFGSMVAYPFYETPDRALLLDSVDPEKSVSYGTNYLKSTKADFLSAIVGRFNETELTVEELIKFVLYNMGGTHYAEVHPEDTRGTKRNAVTLEMLQRDSIFGQSVLIHSLKAIGNITLSALADLEIQARERI